MRNQSSEPTSIAAMTNCPKTATSKATQTVHQRISISTSVMDIIHLFGVNSGWHPTLPIRRLQHLKHIERQAFRMQRAVFIHGERQ